MRQDRPDPKLTLTHEGVTWELSYRDFNAVDDLAVWKATGVTLSQVFLHRQLSLFTLAAILWRHRVRAGESDLTYEQVASTFTFDTFETVDKTPDGAEPAPEA